MKKYIIYKIVNLINNKIYVGKHETIDINDDYFGSGTILKHAIKKYGEKNFEKIIIEETTLELFDSREIYWIAELKTITPNGYNINTGGKGGDNFTNNPNKELIRIKFRLQNLGRKATAEQKLACSIRMTGKKLKPHKKIECEFCKKQMSRANHNRSHGIYCKQNPNRLIKEIKREECEFCNNFYMPSILKQQHGIYCKQNPNRIEKDFSFKNITPDSLKKSQETKKQNGNNKQSEESNLKRSITLKNRILTKETKEKMSKSNLIKWENIKKENIKYKCEFCNKEMMLKTNYIRWHGNNCKLK